MKANLGAPRLAREVHKLKHEAHDDVRSNHAEKKGTIVNIKNYALDDLEETIAPASSSDQQVCGTIILTLILRLFI